MTREENRRLVEDTIADRTQNRKMVIAQIDMHKAFNPDTPRKKRGGENLSDLANGL